MSQLLRMFIITFAVHKICIFVFTVSYLFFVGSTKFHINFRKSFNFNARSTLHNRHT